MNQKLITKLTYKWLPVFLWAGIIFFFSANPTTSTSEIHWQDFIVKKTLHVIFFGTLATLFYRALRLSEVGKQKAGSISIIFAFLYGVTDEIHQSFTPGRMPRAYDVFFDTIGAVLAIYIIWKWLHKMPKILRIWAKRLDLN